MFRLEEDEGVINRYGFNSAGSNAVLANLKAYREKIISWRVGGLLGVNLGKNKLSTSAVTDYEIGIKKFSPVADYLVINVSR